MTHVQRGAVVIALSLFTAVSLWAAILGARLSELRAPLELPVAQAAGTIEFFGFEPGSTFVWCLDRSDSMGWAGDLDLMKFEVARTLEQLSPDNEFSIVSFANDVTQWSSTLVDATPSAVDSAIAYVAGLNGAGPTCLLPAIGNALSIAATAPGDVSILLVGNGPHLCGGTELLPSQLVSSVAALNPTSIPIHCFHLSLLGDAGIPTYQALATAFGGASYNILESVPAVPPQPFIRGDSNGDGTVEISDVVHTLEWLFFGEPTNCLDASDVNDDGQSDVSDPVYLLQYLFSGSGNPPPLPFPTCNVDPTCDLLSCDGPVSACPVLDFIPFAYETGISVTRDAAVGDFNDDGILDLVLCVSSTPTSVCITFLEGTGAGDFSLGSSISIPFWLTQIETGDLNDDGILDLMLNAPSLDRLVVLLGTGDGTFTGPFVTTTSIPTESVALGDVNNDDYLDVVWTGSSSNVVVVQIGNGDGTFSPETSYGTGNNPVLPFVEDFDNDGNLDIAASALNSDDIYVRLGNSTGTFGPPFITAFLGQVSSGIAVGDMNNDSLPDLLALSSSPDAIQVYLGAGDGTFSLASTRLLTSTGRIPALGDINQDGRLDIVSTSTPGIRVHLGDGAGGLTEYLTLEVPPTASLMYLKLFDYDQDGDLDVLGPTALGESQISENLLAP